MGLLFYSSIPPDYMFGASSLLSELLLPIPQDFAGLGHKAAGFVEYILQSQAIYRDNNSNRIQHV